MSTNMVVTQPRPYIMPNTSSQWTSGICECCEDLPQCCLAFWCPSCFACKTSYEADECVCLPLLDGCGFIPPIGTALRVSVRRKYGIEGTICKDCLFACCCPSCNWCQIAREIKMRNNPITFISMTS